MTDFQYQVDNVKLSDGRKVSVRVYGRTGTKSPTSWYVILGGEWLTPYQQRRDGICFDTSGILRVSYGNVDMRSLVYSHNPFLEMIPKEEPHGWSYPLPMFRF